MLICSTSLTLFTPSPTNTLSCVSVSLPVPPFETCRSPSMFSKVGGEGIVILTDLFVFVSEVPFTFISSIVLFNSVCRFVIRLIGRFPSKVVKGTTPILTASVISLDSCL